MEFGHLWGMARTKSLARMKTECNFLFRNASFFDFANFPLIWRLYFFRNYSLLFYGRTTFFDSLTVADVDYHNTSTCTCTSTSN